MSLEFHQFCYRSDNYGVLIHDPASGETACVDVGSEGATAELAALAQTGWKLTQIWITHHHGDHTAGLEALKAATGAQVYGPDNAKITGIDTTLGDGDNFSFAGQQVQVIHTPGHTLDMLNYHLPQAKVVFTGDTLFALGCGRVFEGDIAMMHNSLEKLKGLPDETVVYCSHEYTQANAKFCLSFVSDNEALANRAELIDQLRAAGEATVPTTIGLERATNPFFYADSVEAFTEVRSAKDKF